MFKNEKIFPLLILLICFNTTFFAQSIPRSVIGTSGKNVSNTSGSLFYNVGEVALNTYSSSANFITEGFVQPADFNSSSISTTVAENPSISVFPNPAFETIFITSVNEFVFSNIELVDILGRKIFDSENVVKISSSKSSINISSLAKGMYFLTIKDKSHKSVSFFRLIKS